MNNLTDEYFDWMCSLVVSKRYSTVSYDKLLHYLYNTEFLPIFPHDENRAGDGIDLRYSFADETGHSGAEVAAYLDIRGCSMLEMMVALARRCEVHIMDDSTYGDRTGEWFWNMIVSLGLGHMDDNNFDERYTQNVVDIFMSRNYSPDGEGGLFTIKGCDRDLRTVEIWYQLCWYLNTLL